MKFDQVPAILGLTTAAVVASAIAPVQAQAAQFTLVNGVTSVFLDTKTLSSVGLNLTGASNTVDPVSDDFLVGFPITPATDFTFSFGPGGFAPVGGTIEHTGSVTFNNTLTLGNFSIGFDPTARLAVPVAFLFRTQSRWEPFCLT